MTYSEASRQAEEDARWIRNAKAEMAKREARLEQCQAVISAALATDVVAPAVPTLAALMDPVPVADEAYSLEGAVEGEQAA